MIIKTRSASELSIAKKLVFIGGIALIILLVLNWVFGGWFFNTLFSSEWRKLWSPGKTAYVPEGWFLAVLLTLSSLLGLGLSELMAHSTAQNNRGSGPVLNPPFMIPGFYGLAALVGGGALVLRYTYILGLFGYFASTGLTINFSASRVDLKPISPVPRTQVDSLAVGVVGPDTRDDVLRAAPNLGSSRSSGGSIPKGVLIKGDLGDNWSKYPVRALLISYTGGPGIFESLDEFAFEPPQVVENQKKSEIWYARIAENGEPSSDPSVVWESVPMPNSDQVIWVTVQPTFAP